MHGNKAKPFYTAIRPSSKIWKSDLHRNKAKLEKIWKSFCTAIRPSSKISKFILHRIKAKLGQFSLALLPCTSVLSYQIIINYFYLDLLMGIMLMIYLKYTVKMSEFWAIRKNGSTTYASLKTFSNRLGLKPKLVSYLYRSRT